MTTATSDQNVVQQQRVLTYIGQAIAGLGYETRLFPAEDGPDILAGPLLVVGVERDAQGRDRMIHFGFLPLPAADDFDYLSLVQCYAALPFAVPEQRRQAVEHALSSVNNQTTVGYFGMTADGHPFYRYVLATPKWALLEPESLQQMAIVFVHLQNRFAPLIEAVARGEQSAEQALQM